MKNLFWLTLSIVLMMNSCNSSKISGPSYKGNVQDLYTQQWNLSSLDGQAVTGERIPNLKFADGESKNISGFAGCNRFLGKVEFNQGNKMTCGPLAVTRMACMDTNVETAFLAAMNKADHWSITDKQLSLYQGETVLAIFEAAVASNATALNGTWELNYITGPRIAFDGLYPEKKPMVSFNVAAGEFNGHSSCNSISGKFTVEGNGLRFGNARSTMMACPGNGEQTFMKMLNEINTFSFDNPETLVLLKDKLPMMRFTKK